MILVRWILYFVNERSVCFKNVIDLMQVQMTSHGVILINPYHLKVGITALTSPSWPILGLFLTMPTLCPSAHPPELLF